MPISKHPATRKKRSTPVQIHVVGHNPLLRKKKKKTKKVNSILPEVNPFQLPPPEGQGSIDRFISGNGKCAKFDQPKPCRKALQKLPSIQLDIDRFVHVSPVLHKVTPSSYTHILPSKQARLDYYLMKKDHKESGPVGGKAVMMSTHPTTDMMENSDSDAQFI